jgi:hypothetical protein
MKSLRDTGASMEDAKAVALHLTARPAECHRCNSGLVGGTEVICAKCRSLNFDW